MKLKLKLLHRTESLEVIQQLHNKSIRRTSAYSTSVSFNNRNLDEVIAVNSGEKAPLIQGVNC